jgi:hypothetical protein
MSKILTLAATGLAGVVLGAGIGIAAAGDTTPTTVGRSPDTPTMDMGSMDMGSMDMAAMDMAAMDEMHASMRDQMPAGMTEQCDEMNAAMAARRGGRHDSDTTVPGSSEVAPEDHQQHHPDEQKDG